ncbi:hypothetical protein FRB90_001104, partial [Tulasnella sp. 427]
LVDGGYVCRHLEEVVLENELSIDSATVRTIVEARAASTNPGGGGGIKWVTLRGCDIDLIKAEDVDVIAQLTKGVAYDLVTGEDAREEASGSDSEDSDDTRTSESDSDSGLDGDEEDDSE